MKLAQNENWGLTVLELVQAVFVEAFLVDVLPGLFVRVAPEEVLADLQLLKGIGYILKIPRYLRSEREIWFHNTARKRGQYIFHGVTETSGTE